MIGKFQKCLSARAKQLDTSLWKHFFRIVMFCIKLLGILWLATASVAVWEGISADHFEHRRAGSPALLHPCISRAFLGLGAPDDQAAQCLQPSYASPTAVSERFTTITKQHRFQLRNIKEELKSICSKLELPRKLTLGQVDGCVPPKAASLATRLPLPFFLPEGLTGTGTFQRKKSQSNSWREFVLFLLLVESYKKHINMFYSLGSHWHLMESCKNVLENDSTFLFCSAFYFLKLLKIAAHGNSYYSILTYLLHMEHSEVTFSLSSL